MEAKVFNSITEIEESEWDEIVCRNRIICTHRFLEAVEKSNINDCKYFYLLVYDNDKIIAHTCTYSINMELDIFAEGIAKKIITVIRKVWKNFLIIKLFECGNPIALGNTISFADGINKNQILQIIIKQIENIAKKQKIGILIIRDFYEHELRLFDNLKSLGYGRTCNLPSAIINVRWNTFEEYLSSMRSNSRINIRKKQKKFNNNGIEIQVLNNFSSYASEFTFLWSNLYNNAKEYRREILTPAFFENMDKYLKNQTQALVFKKDNLIIGYILLIYNDEILIPLFAGLDYEMNKKYIVYFNLLYKVIEIGIIKKMKCIDFGITTLETKKRLGAEIINLYIYMKHLNPILNFIINKIFNMFTPKLKLLSHKIFK